MVLNNLAAALLVLVAAMHAGGDARAALCPQPALSSQPAGDSQPAESQPAEPQPPESQRRYLRLSPFEDVRWIDDPLGLQVKVGGEWFELVAFDQWPAADLFAAAQRLYGDQGRRRIEEDLVELLSRAGREPRQDVTLTLRDVTSGAEHERIVRMTEENRRALRDKRRAAPDRAPQAPVKITPAALAEVAELIASLDSYAVATGAADRLRAAADRAARTPGLDVAAALHELTGSIIDGHAAVSVEAPFLTGPWLPMLLCPVGDERGTGIVAVTPDRRSFVDPDRPFIMEINGAPIEQLIERQQPYIADGSPALRRERACRMLRSAAAASIADPSAPCTVAVAAVPTDPPSRWRTLSINLTPRKPISGAWPPAKSRRIEPTTAYLRLAEMSADDADLNAIDEFLQDAAECSTLIIDVRGNGGGRREPLLLIASRILPADAAPVVYNAARPLRLPGEDPAAMDQRMHERFMRRAGDDGWSPAQRGAIDSFAAAFRVREPGITLDDQRFGPWYYAVISPDPDGRSWYRPGRRVLVLMDNACFSATDAWLVAMDQLPHVTLMGRPSAGGSGLALDHVTASGIQVRLSSMVSLTPTGLLIDGRGVTPDVVLWPIPTDFVAGGTDSMLDAAIARSRRTP
ncbi:MAG: hypothetical protein AMXMBFR58_14760 [Phycisphaerae bacterium]